ncbi:MAG: antibiotic biosynthesis monooxygenase [Betaproteobacteria bacterium]|nr:antibiotic biosynthesis monooxygenase [Betaproteobacteria bacterium]
MTMLALGAAGEVRAQGTGSSAVYQVTYVEVMPAAKTSATALLRQLGSASRGAAGNQRFEILQRRDRPNHFAIIETWRDQAAEDANLAAGHMKQFREKLQPMLSSAYDERPHTGLAVGPIDAGGGSKGAAVYAVTHVDIIPPKKDDGIAALQQLAEPSRKDAGNLRYEVLQQNSRPNHFTLVEIWRAQSAVENHEVSPHTRKFREMLLPMSGSLYDQRLYRALQP